MKKHIMILVIIAFINASEAKSCSTFMFKNESVFIIGQNLDMSNHANGYFTYNKRNVVKRNMSWSYLSSGIRDQSPVTTWVSKYGSVSFSPWAREFAEGGINEAGLYVREMTLQATSYPASNNLPKMFMMQWVQYQLDNFKTVHEVIENAEKFAIDGQPWHFFIADADGNSAALEFIGGKAVIHTGNEMPYKVLCNSTYSSELQKIAKFQGFGGTNPINMNDISVDNRFVYASHMMKTCTAADLADPVSFGFSILKKALGNPRTQLSVLVDVKNKAIYFRTSVNQNIRYFSAQETDFECGTNVRILDIKVNATGDVNNKFFNYSREESITRTDYPHTETVLNNIYNYIDGLQCQGNTSVNNISNQLGFSVSPNPVSNDATISLTCNVPVLPH